jgi:phosphinothricin acetyltransferase
MPATIRLATGDDAAAIAAIYAPFCTESIVSFEEAAPTAEEIAARIAKVAARYPYLVLDDGGTVAGYAYASPHRDRAAYRWTAEVTVYVRPDYHRRGVGRALYTALLALLTRQGYHLAVGGVTLPNSGSEGLHEAMGFVEVGVYRHVGYKLGAWRDVRWYQRPLHEGEPVPVLSMAELVADPAWGEAVAAGLACYRGA